MAFKEKHYKEYEVEKAFKGFFYYSVQPDWVKQVQAIESKSLRFSRANKYGNYRLRSSGRTAV